MKEEAFKETNTDSADVNEVDNVEEGKGKDMGKWENTKKEQIETYKLVWKILILMKWSLWKVALRIILCYIQLYTIVKFYTIKYKFVTLSNFPLMLSLSCNGNVG